MADVRLTATNPEDSSLVPVACDASGRLLLQDPEVVEGPPGPPGPEGPPGQDGKDGDPFSGNFAGDVTFGGNANFAGQITTSGVTNYGLGTNGGFNLSSGKCWIRQDGGNPVFATYNGGGDTENIVAAMYGNGKGYFAGDFTCGGSAEFAGDIAIGDKTYIGAGYGGVYIAANTLSGGTLFLYKSRASNAANDGNSFCRFYSAPNVDTPKTEKIGFRSDGSAEFAGGKAGFTGEGYLWCTTRRGDTVILEATSQGMGIWENYTPPSRVDEIRDKLDANRLDTGEMPADTP